MYSQPFTKQGSTEGLLFNVSSCSRPTASPAVSPRGSSLPSFWWSSLAEPCALPVTSMSGGETVAEPAQARGDQEM
jgi:hypothetical protein